MGGGGARWGGGGRAPGTHVLLILRIERVHHILRGFGIVAALLETLHRVRLGLLHRHLSARTCTAGWTVDAGAARVSPALSGAVGRGNARVSGLGRGAGLVHQLQTVGDCVGSGCGGCAGVRSSSTPPCEGRKKGHGSVQHPADREPGARGWRARATRSDARGRARRDRYIAEVVPASAFRAWARRSRAPTPGAAPCRSERHESFFCRSGDSHAPGGFRRIALPTARDALSGQSRRAQTASGLYPAAWSASRPPPSPMARWRPLPGDTPATGFDQPTENPQREGCANGLILISKRRV